MLAAIIDKVAKLKAGHGADGERRHPRRAAREGGRARPPRRSGSRKTAAKGQGCEDDSSEADDPRRRALAGGQIMNKSDYILFSGGAPGAEAEFGACAERHGIEEVNFTFDGHIEARRRGVRVLNHEELQAGDVSLEYVSRLMHRRYTDSPLIRKVLQTLWYQVNHGQEIYVLGVIQEDGTVRGGTGWGAEFAKLCNKPLFVFDQEKDGWFELDRRCVERAGRLGRRPFRIRTSPAPARGKCTTTASARSRISSPDPSSAERTRRRHVPSAISDPGLF